MLVDTFSASSRRHGGIRFDGPERRDGLSADHGYRTVGAGRAHCQHGHGAITRYSVYVPADDFTDPAAVLRSRISPRPSCFRANERAKGFPAMDPLLSSSKMDSGNRWRTALWSCAANSQNARAIRGTQGHHCDVGSGAAVAAGPQLVGRRAIWSAFSRSPSSRRSNSPGSPATRQLEDALEGCERILRDEFKDYPESALYMIGRSAKRSPRRLRAAAKAGAKLPPTPEHAADAMILRFFCPSRYSGGYGRFRIVAEREGILWDSAAPSDCAAVIAPGF